MKLKTFRASSMAEALADVKRELGGQAVILHTRSSKQGGLFGIGARTVVEVTASDRGRTTVPKSVREESKKAALAANPLASNPVASAFAASAAVAAGSAGASGWPDASSAAAVPSRPFNRPSAEPKDPLDQALDEVLGPADRAPSAGAFTAPSNSLDSLAGFSLPSVNPTSGPSQRPDSPAAAAASVARQVIQRASVAHPTDSSLTVAPSAPSSGANSDLAAITADLRQEMVAIKRMVGQVLRSTGPGIAPDGSLAAPLGDHLLKHYLRLIECEVAREVADGVVAAIRDELSPAELADDEVVRSCVLRHLSNLLPVGPEAGAPAGRQPDGRPLTIALIGPTGVGKTTTLAKLAAGYHLRQGKRVGVMTTDTYRIAAVEQLRTYAQIIGLELKVAMTPMDAGQMCAELSDCDVILVDTAGRSPGDISRLDELEEFLAVIRPHETHLVMSSTSSEATLMRIAERFGELRPGHIVFTKLDEAASFGVLVNVASRVNARLSYITTGQEVPSDIEPGRSDRLARLILDGSAVK